MNSLLVKVANTVSPKFESFSIARHRVLLPALLKMTELWCKPISTTPERASFLLCTGDKQLTGQRNSSVVMLTA
jgi:hypothetical protein